MELPSYYNLRNIHHCYYNNANLWDFISANNLTEIGFKSSIFLPVWSWNLMDNPENNRAHLLCYFKLCAAFLSDWWIQTGVTVRKRPIWVKIDDFWEPRDLEIWHMTLKNDKADLPSYFKLCTAFRSPWWIRTGVTVRSSEFGSHSTVFLAVWPWNLTYDLEKRIAQSGSNSTIFRAAWPGNLTADLEKQ